MLPLESPRYAVQCATVAPSRRVAYPELMTENHASDLYDAVNTWGADDEFFLRFAASADGGRVLDLGCGTGRITVPIADAGCAVMGIDPDVPSLDAARAKTNSGGVEWIEGDSSAIPASYVFDAAIMSANVAQQILDDSELARSFTDIAAHLAPGGRLAFDSRDPRARGWEAWTKEHSHKVISLPEGETRHWYQTTRVDEKAGLIEFCAHEVGPDGIERMECGPIRFRSEDQLRTMLNEAGLVIDELYGGFKNEPVGKGTGSLVFIARRP